MFHLIQNMIWREVGLKPKGHLPADKLSLHRHKEEQFSKYKLN